MKVYGAIPGAWRDALRAVAFTEGPASDLSLVNFDNTNAADQFKADRKKLRVAVPPLVLGVSDSNLDAALIAGADVALASNASPALLIAQLHAMDKRLSLARHHQKRLTALRHRLSRIMANYRAIDTDLAQARALQKGLLQNRQSNYDGSVVSLLLEERSQLGGDLVGQFPVNDHTVGFFAFDVSGHGITSALLIARLAGMVLGTSADTNIAIAKRGDGHVPRSPSLVLETLNRIMFDELETEHFFTAILGFFDHRTGRVVLSQAGHPNPLLIQASGEMRLVGQGGLPIGLVPGAEFSDISVAMSPHDRLFIPSDGITETPSQDGKSQVTETGLAWLLAKYQRVPGLELFEHLLADLRRFQGRTRFEDDVSAVLIDYRPDAINSATAQRSPETANSVAAVRADIQTAV